MTDCVEETGGSYI